MDTNVAKCVLILLIVPTIDISRGDWNTCNVWCKNGECRLSRSARDYECRCYGGFCGNNCERICNCKTYERSGSLVCSTCKKNFWGTYCDYICSANCYNYTHYSSCVKDTGHCEVCTYGHWGDTCKHECSKTCVRDICDKPNGKCAYGCDSGYYGDRRTNSCSNCLNGRCNRTTGTCSDGCENGYYGDSCTNSCSNCLNGRCYRITGVCIDGCENGHFGVKCNQICPLKCKSNTCKKLTGTCGDGCKDGYYDKTCSSTCDSRCTKCASQHSCDTCAPGYFNSGRHTTCNCKVQTCNSSDSNGCSSCDSASYRVYPYNNHVAGCCPCSKTCKDRSCNSNGRCSSGCRDGWHGSYCENSCNSSFRYCKRCELISNSLYCLECEDGQYPYRHNQCSRCDDKCKSVDHDTFNSKCNSSNGMCYENCKNGNFQRKYSTVSGTYYGHCEKCSQNCREGNPVCRTPDGYCAQGCKNGFYGKSCNLSCSSNCKQDIKGNPICDMKSGYCLDGCVDGFFGKTCNTKCNENCLNSKCEGERGKCTEGCKMDWYGDECDEKCSANCMPFPSNFSGSCPAYLNICARDDGFCINGCTQGWFGSNCTSVCSKGCTNFTCVQDNGTCSFSCLVGFTGDTCNRAESFTGNDDKSTGTTNVVIGGAVGGAVLMAILVVIIVILHRRKKKTKVDRHQSGFEEVHQDYSNADSERNDNQRCSRPVNASVANPVYQLPHNKPISVKSVRQDDDPDEDEKQIRETVGKSEYAEEDAGMYYNTASLMRRPVKIEKLWEVISKKTEDDFKQEFERLPKGLVRPHNEALKASNAGKNRYRLLYPYDETRVVLDKKHESGDYINASYIDGFDGPKKYIAALGPIDTTVDDFWRMIWQENTGKIVILTNPVENGHMKCLQYWPIGQDSIQYGKLSISKQSEEVYGDYAIRQLRVSKDKQPRTVLQFHFTAWPDKGVPNDVTGMIEFRDKVKMTPSDLTGPIVVHCSAGIGRTGTFLALDYLTMEGEKDGDVDIFGCLVTMRHQRVGLVQAEEQYKLLHFAVNQSLCPETRAVHATDFSEYYETIKKNPNDRVHIDCQFERLTQVDAPSEADRAGMARNSTYKSKNRDPAIVPADRYRPRLFFDVIDSGPGSDYVNAVFVDSLKKRNAFIVTQSPLPDTTEDFLRIIFQYDVANVIMLNQITGKKKSVPLYWPAISQVLKPGKFIVNVAGIDQMEGFQVRHLNIQHKDRVKIVKQFCASFWQDTETVPKNISTLLKFIEAVENSGHSGEDSPTFVHCLNGVEKSGLYCTVVNMLEKLKMGQDVSVANTVRQIRARRPGAVTNIEQYKFCHEAVLAYIATFRT